MKNIYLLGMMGAGKTTTGKKLAKLLQFNFIDLDQYVSEKAKQSIHEIFEQQGENYFRKLEQIYLQEIIHTKQKTVIALGGGTPCFFDNLEQIKKNGITIYLQVKNNILLKRLLENKHKRPLLQNLKTAEDLFFFIEKKINEREIYYKQSQFVFTESMRLEKMAEKIKAAISDCLI